MNFQTCRISRRALSCEELERRSVLSITLVDSGQTIGMGNTNSVALGDIDGDGDLDAITGEARGGSKVWRNDGLGNFSDSGQSLKTFLRHPFGSFELRIDKAILGDMDSDGDLDVFLRGIGGPLDTSTRQSLWINDGLGAFSESPQAPDNIRTDDVAVGDLDGDGDLDAIFAQGGNSLQGKWPFALQPWIHDGQGNFVNGEKVALEWDSFGDDGGRHNVILGDIDGDQDLDAVTWVRSLSDRSPRPEIWLNDGSAVFEDWGCLFGTVECDDKSLPLPAALGLADLDADRDLDVLVLANSSRDGSAEIWLNDGSGNFHDGELGFDYEGTVFGGATLVDLDQDGDFDAFVSTFGPDSGMIWLNGGTGRFVPSGHDFGTARNVAFGDLDGDGDWDAFVIGRGPSTVWRLELRATEAAIGDANSDGRFDISDIIQVLQFAKFMTGQRASFAEGDWNDDGVFDELDIVEALQAGTYGHSPE